MRRFEYEDIEFDRGILWEATHEVFDEDNEYVPVSKIITIYAVINSSDRIDGTLITAMNTDIVDDVKTTIRTWLPENVTTSFTEASVHNPAGYWFLYFIDEEGERIPLKRGKVMVR